MTQNTTEHCRLSQCNTERYGNCRLSQWDTTLQKNVGCDNVKQNTIEHCRLLECDAEHFTILQAITMWNRTL